MCPICGGPLKEVPAIYLEDRGMIVANGGFALLTGNEGIVMSKLIASFPGVASRGAIHNALYSMDLDGGADPRIIDVFVCKIRKKIKNIGIRIDNSHGRGYALSTAITKARSVPDIV